MSAPSDRSHGTAFSLKSDSAAPQPRSPLKPSGDSAPPAARPERRRKDTARLVWNSKPKRPPSPRDIEFQTAEVVIPNPARDAAQLPLSFSDGILGNDQVDRAQMNRLIWGDNLLAMQALLTQGYEGKIDLIYIDPPFDSKADYSYRMTINEVEVTKEPSVIERLAYRDTWEAGTDSYLDMLYPRLQLMRRLLSDGGSVFVHVGGDISQYVKVLLDEVFGKAHSVNEIIWKRRTGYMGTYNRFGVVTESIHWYAKSDSYVFSEQTIPNDPEYLERFKYRDAQGRLYRLDNLTSPNPRQNLKYTYKGVLPPENGWAVSRQKMEQMDREGRLEFPKMEGGRIQRRRFLDELKGQPVQNLWDDVFPVNPMAGGGWLCHTEARDSP